MFEEGELRGGAGSRSSVGVLDRTGSTGPVVEAPEPMTPTEASQYDIEIRKRRSLWPAAAFAGVAITAAASTGGVAAVGMAVAAGLLAVGFGARVLLSK